jgi:hypothetical protein
MSDTPTPEDAVGTTQSHNPPGPRGQNQQDQEGAGELAGVEQEPEPETTSKRSRKSD